MSRKIAVDLLKLHQGELGIWKRRKVNDSGNSQLVFDTLLNFNLEVIAKVTLGGAAGARGSGAIYRILIPGEEAK